MRKDQVAGAVLLNMETGDYLVARAKTVIIATGGAGRMHYQGFADLQPLRSNGRRTGSWLPCSAHRFCIRIRSSIIRPELLIRHRFSAHW